MISLFKSEVTDQFLKGYMYKIGDKVIRIKGSNYPYMRKGNIFTVKEIVEGMLGTPCFTFEECIEGKWHQENFTFYKKKKFHK